MRIGCQTYSWEMMGDRWRGTRDDILDTVAASGYDGIEFSSNVIGRYWDHPDDFEAALSKRGLVFCAFAYATSGFTDAARFDEDMAGAKRALALARRFDCVLCLGSPCSDSRDNYDAKLEQAVMLYGEVARLGGEMGVAVAVHPNSAPTSLVLSPAEYDGLLAATASSGLKFNPDSGHMIRSGHNLLESLQKHLDRIAHVHVKDVDSGGKWMPMGKGISPYPEMLAMLKDAGYGGWIVVEEESDAVWEDVGKAVADNYCYLRSIV